MLHDANRSCNGQRRKKLPLRTYVRYAGCTYAIVPPFFLPRYHYQIPSFFCPNTINVLFGIVHDLDCTLVAPDVHYHNHCVLRRVHPDVLRRTYPRWKVAVAALGLINLQSPLTLVTWKVSRTSSSHFFVSSSSVVVCSRILDAIADPSQVREEVVSEALPTAVAQRYGGDVSIHCQSDNMDAKPDEKNTDCIFSKGAPSDRNTVASPPTLDR